MPKSHFGSGNGDSASHMPKSRFGSCDGDSASHTPKSHFGSGNGESASCMPKSRFGSGDGESASCMPKSCFGSGDGKSASHMPKSCLGSGDGESISRMLKSCQGSMKIGNLNHFQALKSIKHAYQIHPQILGEAAHPSQSHSAQTQAVQACQMCFFWREGVESPWANQNCLSAAPQWRPLAGNP